MALADESVEALELAIRKVARGEVPSEGDVLLRANRGWVFSAPLLDMALLRYDGDLAGGDVKPVTNLGFAKFSGANAVPDDSFDIYEESVSRGPGSIIEEDIANGELLFKVPGLYTISVGATTLPGNGELALFTRSGDGTRDSRVTVVRTAQDDPFNPALEVPVNLLPANSLPPEPESAIP